MKFRRLRHYFGKHKKIWTAVLIVLVLAIISGLVYWRWLESAPVSRTNPDGEGGSAEPTIKIVPSPLTGLDVSEKLAERPVTGVMIENSPQARPHSGLNDAGVVFEAIAEGGITRFLALYQEAQPKLIGPVRSIRPYYVDWSMGFESSVAHVGGSEEGLRLIRTLPGARDLDQFSGGSYFFRSSDRFAPHNMYTRMSLLDKYTDAKGFGPSEFDPIPRKEPKPAKEPKAKSINIDMSSGLFRINYQYSTKHNHYLRSTGGQKHLDRESGKQMTSDVVVVLKMPFSLHPNGQHSVYETLDGGEATIFQDGGVTKGTWSKASRTAMVKLKNSDGKTIELNPGKTWFVALPESRSVTYE